MKKNIKSLPLFLLILLLTTKSFGQKIRTKDDYLNVVHRFYEYILSDLPISLQETKTLFDWEQIAEKEAYLFAEDCKIKHIAKQKCSDNFKLHYMNNNSKSFYFLKMKEMKLDLTIGLGTLDVFNILRDSSILIDYGSASNVVIDLKFPNRKHIYFSLNKYPDEQCTINDINMTDGKSVYSKIMYNMKNVFLKIPGTINDVDGYVYIRKEPNIKSSILGVINTGDHFSYTPNSNSLWWKVEKTGTAPTKGYVYYDRITPLTK